MVFGIYILLVLAQVFSISVIFGVFPTDPGVEGGDGGGTGQAPHPQAAAVRGHSQVGS